jgi:hypothetical protein
MKSVPPAIPYTTSSEAQALACIKRHLPALQEVYQVAGSRKIRRMVREFETLVETRRNSEPQQ